MLRRKVILDLAYERTMKTCSKIIMNIANKMMSNSCPKVRVLAAADQENEGSDLIQLTRRFWMLYSFYSK